jgi:rfaE bifunctional protein nucleotidyltransferase chain/domain
MAELHTGKVIDLESAPARFAELRAKGVRIAHSHGIFDLIHAGHIDHLEAARALADVLVVTVTADAHVHKGPGRPYFNEKLRVRSLSALACVDYVILTPHAGAVEAIRAIRPHFYCKGKEYEDPEHDESGELREEARAVESEGGELRFVGGIKASSTKLLNLYFEHLSGQVREFCAAIARRHSRQAFAAAVDSLADLRILVVGETILDRYSQVRVQGLTSKSRVLSGQFLSQETHCGGALAVFRHVRQFTRRVRFLSVTGAEDWVDPLLAQNVAREEDMVVRAPGYTTIIKERFIEPRANGEPLNKLFAVNFLSSEPPAPEAEEELLKRLKSAAAECDAVFGLDFGHGMFSARLREALQELAPLFILNCQTNSSNHGFNIISRQYQRADVFSLDEQEMMLAAGQRRPDFDRELAALARGFGAKYAWLTRGPVETLGLAADQGTCRCPPLERDVVDPVGAGDAFIAVAGLAAARGLPLDLATFMGQLAGAQAVRIVGNARPISKQVLVRAGKSLLEA